MSSHFRSEPVDPSATVEPLLTYRQAAKVLGVTERTIWTLVDQGALPVARFGRSVRIDPVDLRGFIDRAKGNGAGRGACASGASHTSASDGGVA